MGASDNIFQSAGNSMQGRLPRKMKRYLTEPDEFTNENKSKYNNLTLKELKLHVSGLDHLNEIAVHPQHRLSDPRKLPHHIPLQTKIHHKRNALKKLPEISNQPHPSNGQEQGRVIPGPPLFKRTNPLFVVNTLFHILKDDEPQSQSLQPRPNRKKTTNEANEFSEFGAKSVKIHRAPRLVDNELNRLTQQSNFSRRRIYSEEKSRPKGQETQMELLTFYKPKEQGRSTASIEETNEFLG